jgi:ribosomal protein S18 acetylase RimI-like enzyme
MITFRPATDQDSDFVFQTKKAAFQKYVEQVWGWKEEDQRAMHDRRFGLQDFEIVSKDGQDVAVLATVSSPDKIDLTGIFVLPDHQRQGIGTECVAEVRRRAGGTPIHLQVLKVNTPALAFFTNLGFTPHGENDTHHLLASAPQ